MSGANVYFNNKNYYIRKLNFQILMKIIYLGLKIKIILNLSKYHLKIKRFKTIL